jgi:hypothetical protein
MPFLKKMESVNRIKEILKGINIKKIIRKDGKQERNEKWLNDFNLTHPFVMQDLVVLKQKNKY